MKPTAPKTMPTIAFGSCVEMMWLEPPNFDLHFVKGSTIRLKRSMSGTAEEALERFSVLSGRGKCEYKTYRAGEEDVGILGEVGAIVVAADNLKRSNMFGGGYLRLVNV